MEKLYTIKELSQELKVPESTLRYYRDRFEEFIPTVGKGRKRRYKKEAIEIFRLIISGYEQDLAFRQIKKELIKRLSTPDIPTIEPKQIQKEKENIIDKQNEILKLLIQEISKKNELEKEVKLLKDKIEKMERILIRLIKDYKLLKKEVKSQSNKEIIDL